MAKEKTTLIQSDTQSIQSINEFQGQMEKKKADQELKKQRLKLDNRMKQLEDTMYEFAEKYGIEDFRTQLMIQFNDIALTMKEQVELISAINTANQYIFETVGFFDESLGLMDSLFETSLDHKYGLFYKIKTNIRNKRAIKNITNRMEAMGKRISQIQGVSMTMVSSVEKATQKMKKTIEKNNEKRAKTMAQNGESNLLKSKSSDMVLEHLKNKGLSQDTESVATTTEKSNTSDSFDDIL